MLEYALSIFKPWRAHLTPCGRIVIITLRHEWFRPTCLRTASLTPAASHWAGRRAHCRIRFDRVATPKSRQITGLRLWHGTHGRRSRAFFREVLPGSDRPHLVRWLGNRP